MTSDTGHAFESRTPTRYSPYERGDASFVAGLLPPDSLKLPVRRVAELLRARYGEPVEAILTGAHTSRSDNAGTAAPGPIPRDTGPDWIARTRMIGVNVRTIGSFWRVVHYALTIPDVYDAVHLLPIWEPGVVGSLYGIASWQLNPEFIDRELADEFPALDTAEAQLEALIAILHLSGRAVGLDVIPHTDRFSEIVLANPACFEWLRRDGTRIVDHRANLHEEVVQEIVGFLEEAGPAGAATHLTGMAKAAPPPASGGARNLFQPDTPEDVRLRTLFGPPCDYEGRLQRRDRLVTRLHQAGYEPVPATMAPPFRGIEVDPDAYRDDSAGRRWYEYRITRPESMSRVFGPLTRYKLYGRRDDNAEWEIDFNAPRQAVFDYFAGHVVEIVNRYGFDFMRGDMSHVQMRPDGVPLEPDRFYDPLAYVKHAVQEHRPSFAYFAETFLAPPGIMTYGDELDHLEASDAEVTLGDLQSVTVGGDEFLPRLRRYLDIASTRTVTPCFTVMTGDKDDPRFDEFYLRGNELRAFVSLFLPSLPSYTALGFELRDPHPEPAANEYYTKLYVFHEESGAKATHGPYRFGSNVRLFNRITRIREFAAGHPAIRRAGVSWLLPPDPTAGSRVIAWALRADNRTLLCVAHTNTAGTLAAVRVPLGPAGAVANPDDDRGNPIARARILFTTESRRDGEPPIADDRMLLTELLPGECRVYELITATTPASQAQNPRTEAPHGA